ncbi:hypothetical protein CkaCkLH20_07151 [Colletotrichum karsti]|uniref:RING-type domain-containing protein n=1 Tax=Colletotrichum karsti TaxID=1095194 RepID=A0A9P6I7C7_9PEZI|nr:uncharacterized protein CkaCkLH20_07151 [Colletotrichum karsti]KAF9875331.1 hypothetical protein CkaCkLH20_07151 [Colletotrichum karsti]
MPVDLNDPEAVRRAIANMPPGPPPGWYPGHPDDPMSHPENFSPERQHLVRRVGDPWPEGIPGGPTSTPSGTAHSQAGSRPGSSHSHRRPSSVASGATSRSGYSSSSRPSSSHSSSGVPSQAFSAGINALNAAHSQSRRNGPRSHAESDVTQIDDASMVTIDTTASELAAMNLSERPTSARGGAYMNPGMPSPVSVAPSAAPSTASSRYSSRSSRAGSIAPSAAPSTASSQYSSRSSRAGSIAPSMLRGPESDAGSVWSGGSSVAPSDSQSSYEGSSRHQRPIRPGVPHRANSSAGSRYSTAGSVASGASYASRNSGASYASRESGATSASRDSGRSGRSSRSGMSSSTQGSFRSAGSSGTIRPPGSVASGTTRGRRSSIESAATQNAGPDGNVFWPDLRPNLSSDAALHNFTVVCPVCATSMRADETTSRNKAKILHCGHMLCMECVVRICANVDGSRDNPNARKPECPLCKEPLGRYPHCSKTCNAPGKIGYPMPRNMEEMRRLPLTIPEGGANPACCKSCRIKNIEVQSKKVIRIILNDRNATVRWNPAVDPDDEDRDDYTRVPELQNFLDVLADTVRDPEISRKYANLYPQVFSPPQHAVAERQNRTG